MRRDGKRRRTSISAISSRDDSWRSARCLIWPASVGMSLRSRLRRFCVATSSSRPVRPSNFIRLMRLPRGGGGPRFKTGAAGMIDAISLGMPAMWCRAQGVERRKRERRAEFGRPTLHWLTALADCVPFGAPSTCPRADQVTRRTSAVRKCSVDDVMPCCSNRVSVGRWSEPHRMKALGARTGRPRLPMGIRPGEDGLGAFESPGA